MVERVGVVPEVGGGDLNHRLFLVLARGLSFLFCCFRGAGLGAASVRAGAGV